MPNFSYTVNSLPISVSLNSSELTFSDQTITLVNFRYTVSYYAAAQLEQQANTFDTIKEKLGFKTSTAQLDTSRNVAEFNQKVPQSTREVPVYLDLVDHLKNRLLIPLDLHDSNCRSMISGIMNQHPNGYLGFGNENETSKALGLRQSNKVLLYVFIALGFFAGMILYGVLVSG